MNTFERLAPFIQDYIYRERWEVLRDIQIAASDVILNTADNLLLMSGTASGKTEAAFLPILTKVYEEPAQSVSILYISPLKALINDQFNRIEKLLEESVIPVTKWHGDASQSAKAKLLRNPQGVIQTTPESLEALLMHRRTDCLRLFADLRYIVIDEMHYFMSSNRGAQLLCQLERIQQLIQSTPIRVGLSATLGDEQEAADWLNTGTKRNCQIPTLANSKRKLRLSLQHFAITPDAARKPDEESVQNYYQYLYAATFGKKCILFSNSKAEVEENIAHLKQMAKKNRSGDFYLVHHGNVSATLRTEAETKMKRSANPIVIGATVTLELGIDLGDLERIVQTGSPFSVSSFVQRLGRTGRREGTVSEMWFAFKEEIPTIAQEFHESINWSFLLCIAIIQLYLEEKWIEPIAQKKYPYDILFHQTLSQMVSLGEVTPAYLAQKMLSLQLFRHISQEDYKQLLRHMLDTNILEWSGRRTLLLGEKGERLVSHYSFYSVFEASQTISVKNGAEEIGTVQTAFPIGERFSLAGRSWEVVECDKDAATLFVKETRGVSSNSWYTGSDYTIDTKIMKKMQEIIRGQEHYKYLGESAAERLTQIRETARNVGLIDETILQVSDTSCVIFPFLGSRELITLAHVFHARKIEVELYFSKAIPVCLFVQGQTREEIQRHLVEMKANPIHPDELDLPEGVQVNGKFNRYMPRTLLRKQYIEDFLSISDLREAIDEICLKESAQ